MGGRLHSWRLRSHPRTPQARPRPPCRRATPRPNRPPPPPEHGGAGEPPRSTPALGAVPPPLSPGSLSVRSCLTTPRPATSRAQAQLPCAASAASGGASPARAQAPPPAEAVPPSRRPGARWRLPAPAAQRAGAMATEGDAFLKARGRTLTAFRQGTRRGGSAGRNLGIGLRVPAGSLPRRAGGRVVREGRAEGRPGAFPGGSGRSAYCRGWGGGRRRAGGRRAWDRAAGPSTGARRPVIGSPPLGGAARVPPAAAGRRGLG